MSSGAACSGGGGNTRHRTESPGRTGSAPLVTARPLTSTSPPRMEACSRARLNCGSRPDRNESRRGRFCVPGREAPAGGEVWARSDAGAGGRRDRRVAARFGNLASAPGQAHPGLARGTHPSTPVPAGSHLAQRGRLRRAVKRMPPNCVCLPLKLGCSRLTGRVETSGRLAASPAGRAHASDAAPWSPTWAGSREPEPCF